MRMFLTESERIQTIKACRDCPMCHPVDLFAQVTGKEANTPRGRAMTLWGLEKGLLSWESEGVSGIFYQAFLDGLPQEWCEGNYDFDELIIGARKTLVEKGLAPAVVSEIARRIRETGNPRGISEKGVSAIVGQSPSVKPEIAIFLGSAARTERPQAAGALAEIFRRLKIGFEVLEEESDSGFLPYQLGDFHTAAAQANKIVDQLKKIRTKKLVVLSASAYRMITTRFARFGAPLPEGLKVLHAAEFLGELLDGGRLFIRKKLSDPVTYHDPCCLARFTYVLEPPRRLLAALCESPLLEMNWAGKQARSCGGCGGVPFTCPEISEKASRLRTDEALQTKAAILASADPECEAMLGRVAQGIAVKDIGELVAEAI
jgi:Fe-S oxidoreductase